jgi:NADH dehydrogenase [ubiquinone] 1 alpha subcomplex assembly factor 5
MRRFEFCRKVLRKNCRSSSQANQKNVVFDRELKRRQRDNSIVISNSTYYDYIRKECAFRLVDRLEDIKRDFPRALDLGAHRGHILDALVKASTDVDEFGVLGGIEELTQTDISKSACAEASVRAESQGLFRVNTRYMDEENIDCDPETYDLIMSSLALHWVNDLPETFQRIKYALKPDGAFVGCMLGGATLTELRHAFYIAEQERAGGISPHCSPFTLPSDIAGLLQGAGFSLPTIDVETITIGYPNALTLMEHLDKMGEGNAALGRREGMHYDTFLATAAAYQHIYGMEDGTVPATFQIIYMIGWAPHTSQPQPLQRGTATRSMKELENKLIK